MSSRRQGDGAVECYLCGRRGQNGFEQEMEERAHRWKWRCNDNHRKICERRAAKRETKNK